MDDYKSQSMAHFTVGNLDSGIRSPNGSSRISINSDLARTLRTSGPLPLDTNTSVFRVKVGGSDETTLDFYRVDLGNRPCRDGRVAARECGCHGVCGRHR